MKFKEIYVSGFGCLIDFKLSLGSHFNLILAPNDEGKTTLQHFITAILYPFAQRGLRERFKPRTHGVYGGNLVYSLSNGQEFEIHKRIKDSLQKDVVKLFEKPSNREITAKYRSSRQGPLFAEDQLSMTRESFEGIPVVRQLQVAEIGDEKVKKSVMEKIKSLATTGKEEMGLDKALGKLDNRLKEIGKTDRGSETGAGRAANRVNELEKEYETTTGLHKELEEVLEEIKTLKRELQGLQRKEKQWDYKVKKARLLDLQAKWNEVNDIRTDYEQKYKVTIPEAELIKFLEGKRGALAKYKKIRKQDIQTLNSKLDKIKENNTRVGQSLEDMDGINKELESLKMQIDKYPGLYWGLSTEEICSLKKVEDKVSDFEKLSPREEADYHDNREQIGWEQRRLRNAQLSFKVSIILFLVSVVSLFWLPVWTIGVSVVFGAAAVGFKIKLWKIRKGIDALRKKEKEITTGLLSHAEGITQCLREAKAALCKAYPINRINPMTGLRSLEEPWEGEDLSFQEIKGKLTTYMDLYKVARAHLLEAGGCKDYDELGDKLNEFRRLMGDKGKLETELSLKQGRVGKLKAESQSLLEEVAGFLGDLFPTIKENPSLRHGEKCVEEILQKQRDYDDLERDARNVRNLLEGKDEVSFGQEMDRSKDSVDKILDKEPSLSEVEAQKEKLSVYKQEHERISHDLNAKSNRLTKKETERDEKLKGRRNLADIKSDLDDARQRLARIQAYRHAIYKAQELLREAGKKVYTDVAPKLNSFLTTRVSQLSSGRYSETSMDEGLNLRVKLRELGSYEDSETLGGGMRAGLYLLLRVGILKLIAEKGGELPPLIMDEAFNSFDDFAENRLERAANMLCDIVKEDTDFQIICFTCQQRGQYLPIRRILESKFGDIQEEQIGNFRVAKQ